MLRLITTACLLFTSLTNAKAQASDTIPFTLTSFNNIYIKSMLNQVDSLKMMFHTGEEGVSITEETLDKIQATKATPTTEANSWGGKGTAQFFKNNTFSIGNHQFDSLIVWVDKHSGQLTDGKFGPPLFKGKIIEVNYNKSIFVIHEAPLNKRTQSNFNASN
jgi:hypothetical protein